MRMVEVAINESETTLFLSLFGGLRIYRMADVTHTLRRVMTSHLIFYKYDIYLPRNFRA